MRFDWYSASVPETDPDHVINYLAQMHPEGDLRTGRPRLGYTGVTSIHDGEGDRWADVLHGGPNGIAIVGTGDAAPAVAQAVRDAWPVHMVSRADVACDMQGGGLMDQLSTVAVRIAMAHRLSGNRIGGFYPGDGTTITLGSRTSQTYGRLYEKGKEQYARTKDKKWLAHFDLVRLELEVKPQKQNRLACSAYSPEQLWGMSRWSRDIAQTILDHPAAKVGVSLYKVSEDEIAMRHMMRQWSKLLGRMKDKNGSWAETGIRLGELFREMESKRKGV
ncbi:MAG: hypothetical protein EOO77_27435 [Oxalobacteraceae bacterium]|nr:MAG: hypothetical protein EOO77_27435 [Oxalobacteraceae bacterium]